MNRTRLAGAAAGVVLVAGLSAPFVGPALAASSDTAPSCGTGTTANAKYVQYVYGKILERCAEPSAESYWAGQLTAGTLSRLGFARRVDLSPENIINNNVIPIYQGIVGRTPDSTETAAWARQIRTHQEDARLSGLLTASDEFYGKATELPADCGEGEDGPPPSASPTASPTASATASPSASASPTASATATASPTLTVSATSASPTASPSASPSASSKSRDEIWLDNAYCQSLDRQPTATEVTTGLAALGSPSTATSRFTLIDGLKHSDENAGGWVGGVYGYGLGRGPSDAEIATGIPYLTKTLGWRTFELYVRVLASDEAFTVAQNPPAQQG